MRRTTLLIFYAVYFFVYSNSASGEGLIEPLSVRVSDWADSDKNVESPATFEVEAIKALAGAAGVPIQIRSIPWSRAMQLIAKQPLAITQLTMTEERKDYIHFIGPYTYGKIVLVVDRQYMNFPIHKLDDLTALVDNSGLPIGYQGSVFYSEAFNRKMKSDKNFSKLFLPVASYKAIHKMTYAKRLVGYLDDRDSAIRILIKPQFSERLGVHPFILRSEPWYLGVSKTVSPVIVNKLKKANAELLENGTYREILRRKEDKYRQIINDR